MDRRALVATAFARSVPAMTRAVVHVSVDPQVGESLAIAWKGSPLGGEPLYIVDDAGGVAATLAAVTCDLLAADADEVLVVAGQLLMPGIRRRLLHDHTADAIARVVNPIARASAVLLPVAARR